MRMRRLLLALAIVAASLVALLGAPPADAQPQLNATWTQKPGIPAPPVGPEPRGWVRVFYDTLNHKMVLMYGSAGHYMNDVWQYDTPGNAWTKIEPYIDCAFLNDFFPATRRDEQVTEYDSFNHLYWMFGGNGYQCAWTHRTAQAGTTTLRVVDPALTESTPNFYKDWTVEANGKLAYVTSYDAVAKVLNLATPIATLAPGATYKVYPSREGGTWHYDPATGNWGSFDGPHWGYTGPKPLQRLSASMAYSPHERALVMFGGSRYNDTWALDVETKTWVPMLPLDAPGSPGRRLQVQNALAYDSVNRVFILFGGSCGNTAQCGGDRIPLNDTWAYDLAANQWTRLNPPTSPPPRLNHHMTFDSHHGVVVMFGGGADPFDANANLDDLWVFHYPTQTWTQLSPPTSPPPQRLGSMVYDPDADVTVFYKKTALWTLRLQATSETGNPAPVITSLNPTGTVAGGPGFTLTVNGTGFISSSVVRWNGSDRATTLQAAGVLQATIPAGDIAASGPVPIQVFNPAPGGGLSPAVTFTVFPLGSGKDLAITDLGLSAGSVAAGGAVTVNYTVRNLGQLAVTESHVERIHLSTDQTLGGDTLLLTSPTHAGLAAGGSLAQSPGVTIPASTTPGPYWILVEADALGAVGETDEGNNVTAIPITVTANTSTRDLVVTSVSLAPASGIPGDTVTVTYTLRNQGSTTITEATTDRLYLSANAVLDVPGDTLLATSQAHTVTFPPGTSRTYVQAVVIPVGTTSGPWQVLVQADALAVTSETSEANNVGAAALTVTPLAPGEIIIDNAAVGIQDPAGGRTFTGKWCASSSSGAYGPGSLYSCGPGSTYRFTPNIPSATTYDVYVRWTSSSTRSASVPWRLFDGALSTTRNFDERVGGGQWTLHGRYTLPAGTAAYMEASGVNGEAAVDAVRLIPVP